jgi:hypothetical protein
MGQKNKEKFRELLNRVEKERTTTKTTTGGSTKTTTVPITRTGYATQWQPKSDLSCGSLVVELAEDNRVDASVPRGRNPSISETAGFAAAIKEGLFMDLDRIHAEDHIPRNYLETSGGDIDRLRVQASLLESYNIPWTISEVEVHNDDSLTAKQDTVIEFGVDSSKTPLVKSKVREELQNVYRCSFSQERLEYLEPSHTDGDITYFALDSNGFPPVVTDPGVFSLKQLPNGDGDHDDVQHLQVIKSGGRKAW